jgi:glycosyltransferase involved in cell wall biosynthesis
MTNDASEHHPICAPWVLGVVCYAQMSAPGASHFLEGVAGELLRRGHRLRLCRPDDPPELVCEDADLVIVHDGLTAAQVSRIGQHRRRHGGYRLLFRHAALQGFDPDLFDLSGYDGVLAAGRAVAELCQSFGMTPRVWVWPDAADTGRFRPVRGEHDGDVVFFGAWGDQDRGVELRNYLLEPVRLLGLRAKAYGPPIPAAAAAQYAEAGIVYGGWAPHDRVPEILGQFRCTVHVPSRSRCRLLPGLPSIRLFEAMACGVPLVSAPWLDCDGLFTAGRDFLLARDGAEMRRHLRALVNDADLRAEISLHARRTILSRHSCIHRTDQLMEICRELALAPLPPSAAALRLPPSAEPGDHPR